ncbi:MAG TPA: NAD(P)H-hydrate dehydratase [Acidimicrobiales bacterium]|nr:NAD(P)H-hydrate dehydratase [Acidimicrobiales bacterium]
MIPVLTPEEMKAVDAAAPEPLDVLVARAGGAVARVAERMLGGTYGRRVVVVAGKGNNGADGRWAAGRLRRLGARVLVVEAADAPAELPGCDLVIDAAYGTGFSGSYVAPTPPAGALVLAVDIPSGVDGLSGEADESAVSADATLTFAALKPGLLLAAGPDRAGFVQVADIGLDTSGARAHLVGDSDVAARLPRRPRESHKWMSAVFVAAGSAGMAGAAVLAGRSALRAGAGNVRLGVPGADVALLPLAEMVGVPLPAHGWARPALEAAERCKALVVGPGLGRGEATAAEVRTLLAETRQPAVVDADGLAAVGDAVPGSAPRVLTPHQGEYERMCGSPPGADRLAAVGALAARTGAVTLLKGTTTVVADPGGCVRFVTSGGPRLATAGSGDVLAGVIGAFLACGLDALDAASLGAHVHGAAAALGPRHGLVAGDIVDLLPRWLSEHA